MNEGTGNAPSDRWWQVFSSISFQLLALAVLLSVDPFVNSPDLGWHLKAGEEILRQRTIPATAWFTYTVPDFLWIDHEWLQQIVLAYIWDWSGEAGLRIYYAGLGAVLITLWIKLLGPVHSPVARGLLAILLAVLLVATRALRPQFFTLFFFTLLILILRSDQRFSLRSALTILAIFFLWANIHGGFPIGFVLIGVFVAALIVDQFLKRVPRLVAYLPQLNRCDRINLKDIFTIVFVTFVSLVATLFNPYGGRIYAEIFRTVGDSYPATIVVEWLPTSLSSHTGEAFFLLAACLLYQAVRGRLFATATPGQLLMVALFFVFGLSATRHAVFFMVLSLPLLREVIDSVAPILERERKVLTCAVLSMATLIGGILFYSRIFPSPNQISSREQFYPLRAIAAVSDKLATRRVFHNVEWGGFLLHTVPGFTTFIDGRMTQWEFEGESFLKRYVDILKAEGDWRGELERFKVDFVMLKRRELLVQKLLESPDTWRLVYEDIQTVALEKISPPAPL